MPPAEIDKDKLPRHVAIIMDGNGRWARREGLTRAEGHEAGAKSVRAVIEACRELERIEVLSLYAFSTENWRRSQREVNTLFRLLSRYIHREIDEIHQENIRVTFMGRREGLSQKTLRDMDYCTELTDNNTAMIVNVALNYGGRAEIVDAAKGIAKDVEDGGINVEDITEARFAQYLYSPEVGDVDLLIRTSGELRLSNFMLWQMSYGEIVAMKTLWPDFRRRHLHKALEKYQARIRRFGGRK